MPSAAIQSRKIAFSIPVKPYIKKYLVAKYGDALALNHKSTIGFIISRVFLKNTADCSRSLDDSFTDSVCISVAQHDVFKNGYRNLTDKSSLDFHNACHQLFIDELSIYVDLYCSLSNSSINAAIEKFLIGYGITESDFKLESLQKAIYRKKLKNVAPVLSSHSV